MKKNILLILFAILISLLVIITINPNFKDFRNKFTNFEKIANAFDIPFKRCHNNGELESCIDWLLEDDNTCFLEILQKLDDPIVPKVMSRLKDDGTFETPALHDMYPFIDKDEIDKWMIK